MLLYVVAYQKEALVISFQYFSDQYVNMFSLLPPKGKMSSLSTAGVTMPHS